MTQLRTISKKFVHVLIFIGIFFIINTCKKNPVEPPLACPDIVNGELVERAVDLEASWSPCGDSLVFIHGDTIFTPEDGIQVMDTTTHTRKVIFPAGGVAQYDPSWSPKGDCIVFWMSAQIFKIKTNGDSLTQLTFSGRNFNPNWSPDGNKIVYDRTDPVESLGVWIMNSDGSDKRYVIKDGRHPSWSPDGSKILYVGPYPHQIYLADTTGSGATQLTSLTGGTGTNNPSFSPSGDKIVFQFQLYGERPDTWIMNADGANVTRLTTDGGDAPFWSPDGSKIIYTNTCQYNGYLWIMNPDGSGKKQISF